MDKIRVYQNRSPRGDLVISIVIGDFDISLRSDKLIISCSIDGDDTRLSSVCRIPMDEFKELIAKVCP